jgi:hypothetical protein
VYVARFGRQLWQRKLTSTFVLIVSVLLAGLLTFQVNHGHLEKRPLSFGVAETQLLINTGQSPLADSTVLTLDIDQLASDYAEIVNSPQVVDPVAARLHIRPSQIYASTQLVQDIPLSDSDALEAQRGVQVIDSGRHYALLARVDSQTFVIQLFAQAPTGREAVLMASTAGQALKSYAANLVSTERIPQSKRVILDQVEPAFGGTVDASLAVEALILFSLLFFTLGMISVLTVARWRRELA